MKPSSKVFIAGLMVGFAAFLVVWSMMDFSKPGLGFGVAAGLVLGAMVIGCGLQLLSAMNLTDMRHKERWRR